MVQTFSSGGVVVGGVVPSPDFSELEQAANKKARGTMLVIRRAGTFRVRLMT